MKTKLKKIAQQLIPTLFKTTPRSIPCQESTLAGFQFYRGEAIWSFLQKGSEVYLEREPNNPHDNNAISVWFKREKLGYIPQSENINLARRMDIGRRHKAKIIDLMDSMNPEHRLRIGVDMVY